MTNAVDVEWSRSYAMCEGWTRLVTILAPTKRKQKISPATTKTFNKNLRGIDIAHFLSTETLQLRNWSISSRKARFRGIVQKSWLWMWRCGVIKCDVRHVVWCAHRKMWHLTSSQSSETTTHTFVHVLHRQAVEWKLSGRLLYVLVVGAGTLAVPFVMKKLGLVVGVCFLLSTLAVLP